MIISVGAVGNDVVEDDVIVGVEVVSNGMGGSLFVCLRCGCEAWGKRGMMRLPLLWLCKMDRAGVDVPVGAGAVRNETDGGTVVVGFEVASYADYRQC